MVNKKDDYVENLDDNFAYNLSRNFMTTSIVFIALLAAWFIYSLLTL